MNFKDLLAISGLPGVYKLVNSRSNGVIIENLESGKTRFCSARKHQITPLESVAIYTMTDSIKLDKIFTKIIENRDSLPTDLRKSNEKIQTYFETIIPDYDTDRVYLKDMIKVLKWFIYLDKYDYVSNVLSDTEEE